MDSRAIARVLYGICAVQARIQLETGTPQSMTLHAQEMRLCADQLYDFAAEKELEERYETAEATTELADKINALAEGLEERVDEIGMAQAEGD